MEVIVVANETDMVDIEATSEALDIDIDKLEPEKELLFLSDGLPVGTVENKTQNRASRTKQNDSFIPKSPRVKLDQILETTSMNLKHLDLETPLKSPISQVFSKSEKVNELFDFKEIEEGYKGGGI